MTSRWVGTLLSLMLLVPNTAFAATNFACGLGDGAQCNCGGVDDCRDLRKSGMCSSAMTCTILYGVYTCSCTAKLQAGGTSRIPTLPNAKKQP